MIKTPLRASNNCQMPIPIVHNANCARSSGAAVWAAAASDYCCFRAGTIHETMIFMTESTESTESSPATPAKREEFATAWRDVDAYFTKALITEDEALIQARESSAKTTLPNAEVAANQAALLGLVTQIAGAKRVLEFGTLAGYSTIWFARAVGPAGQVVTLELEESNAQVARENFTAAHVADREIGRAHV